MKNKAFRRIIILATVAIIVVWAGRSIVLSPSWHKYYFKPADSEAIVKEELSGRDMLFYELPGEGISNVQRFLHLDRQDLLAKPDGYLLQWTDAAGRYEIEVAPADASYFQDTFQLAPDLPAVRKSIGGLDWRWQEAESPYTWVYQAASERSGYRYWFAAGGLTEIDPDDEAAKSEFLRICEDYCGRFHAQ